MLEKNKVFLNKKKINDGGGDYQIVTIYGLRSFRLITKKFPEKITESRRRSIGDTSHNLMLKKELEKIKVSTFEVPALYKVVKK